ncbi:YfhO family protein [Flavobacteriaceae bacterium]|nr:YfhO family protein [Flavobacteriaceae bacterium]
MSDSYQLISKHVLALLLFVAASLAYFYPVINGQAIYQSDIVQYRGMARETIDFRKQTQEESFWNNAAFGGMPTYQLGAQYPHHYIKYVDRALRFLPRPADYLFLYFIGLYLLFLVLKVDYKWAILGALAFGFSTYLIIILGVGHNAKAHAIAYFPWVIGGVLLVFQHRYRWGFILATLGIALELMANHYQMTYYLLYVLLFMAITYAIKAHQESSWPRYAKSMGVLLASGILGIGMNTTTLLATQEYAKESTRSSSELTITPEGKKEVLPSGLDYEYITEYSYGPLESLNLLVPRFMGGASNEPLPDNAKTLNALRDLGATPDEARQIAPQIPMYWGDQPIVAAPAYVGAALLTLAIMSLFLIQGSLLRWVIPSIILALLLSWGRNLEFLTRFFVDYVPLYDKFRAVSSIQVLIELLTPVLAVVGLQRFFAQQISQERRIDVLRKTAYILGGVFGLIFCVGFFALRFAGPYDGYFMDQLGMPFIDAVRADRQTLWLNDTVRSLLFSGSVLVALWMAAKQRFSKNLLALVLGLIIVFDLVGVDKRYVNEDDFVASRIMERPFQTNEADQNILKDNGYFRVLDLTTAPFNSGRASYFHQHIGGYHAAKPKRIQDLYEFYIVQEYPEVLNMLNVKYTISPDKQTGLPREIMNKDSNGPAWFVSDILAVDSSDEALLSLSQVNTKKTAVIGRDDLEKLPLASIDRDTSATIELLHHQPNKLIYHTTSKTEQLAVFSEMYYPKGWQITIDDVPVDMMRVNYVLRALVVPEGQHEIVFVFDPAVVRQGGVWSLMSVAVFAVLVLLTLFQKGRFFYYPKR